MDTVQLIDRIILVCGILAAISIAYMVVRWVRLEIFLWKNSRANVETAMALVYYKDPSVGYLPQGRAGSSVHQITFHTDAGDIITLSMSAGDFYAIEDGARGMLTWQGHKFWRFEPENSRSGD